MDRSRFRSVSALAFVITLGAAAVLGDAAPAVAARPQAAGTYAATFPDTATTSPLVVTNATGSTMSGSFEFTDFGDFGTWVAQGTTVAFLVAASSAGHQGSVLIAKLKATGLDPGEISVPGSNEQPWSAVRTGSTDARHADATNAPTTSTSARPQARPPLVYDAVFDGTVDDTLTLARYQGTSKAGIFGLSNLHDLGTWAKLGKKIVLGITNGEDAGIVMLGTTTPTTIGTPDAPAVYYQQSSGIHPWYATRTS